MSRLFLDTWATTSTADFKPPDHTTYQRVLRAAADSAPGQDGLPYAAWQASSDTGIQTLIEGDDWQRCGKHLHLSHKAVLLAFATKGALPNDHVMVARRPDALRPLALNNTSNKLICAAWAYEL